MSNLLTTISIFHISTLIAGSFNSKRTRNKLNYSRSSTKCICTFVLSSTKWLVCNSNLSVQTERDPTEEEPRNIQAIADSAKRTITIANR